MAKSFFRKKRYPAKKPSKVYIASRLKCGYTMAKFDQEVNMTYSSVSGTGDVTVNWGSNTAVGGTGNQMQPFAAANFAMYGNVYSEYRIIGLRIKFIPITQSTSSVGTALLNILMGSRNNAILSSATTDAAFKNAEDYSDHGCQRPTIKYINIVSHDRSRGYDW